MEKIEMKRGDIEKLYSLLDFMKGQYKPVIKYAIKKNKELLKSEVDSIAEMRQTNVEGFAEFEKKHTELLKGAIAKDKYGQPIQAAPGSYQLDADKMESFKAQTMLLEEEYKSAIEERNNEMVSVNELLEEKTSVSLYKINKEDVPEELTQEQYDIFFSIVKDDGEIVGISAKNPKISSTLPSGHKHPHE